MNVMRITARWVFILLLPVLLLTATIAWAFNSLWIYENGFVKYDVSQELGVSTDQLNRSAAELIAYFNDTHQECLDINVTYDNGETGPLYDQADILHMKDVKGLVLLDYRLLIASGVYVLAYIAASLIWNRRHGHRDLALGMTWGSVASFGLMCFLGFFAVTAFDWFFTTFHEIFFPGGNWQFPPGDHMITLFPEGFWVDVTMLVGLVTLGLALLIGIGGFLWLRYVNRRELPPIV